MPNRILREGILTSPRIAKLGWAEEVFYRRLHSVVDDFGRYFADHGLLLAACYPRQLKKVSDSDIGKWLAACEAAALVRVYPAQDGERYLELLDFGHQIRAKKSKFPNPLSTCVALAQQTQSSAHLDVSVSVSESVEPAEAAPATPKGRKSRLPDDFQPDDTGKRLCGEAGLVLAEELAKFRNHHEAHGTTMSSWQAGFRTWIDKGKNFNKGRPAPSVTVPGTQERDPALVKLEQDSLKAAPPSPEVKARMDAILKGTVYQ